ncbi:Tripeptidyl aminopeptidase precursor [Streptomyces sp. YIM 121038]|uniref:alpha/beta hydrolase n=1 Tax=Streptomyces sp. YIM 121038 TaxID=2136401 RepID=UPI001162C11F|nr:alpha/beta hydrolase [Streptomyces sp. YIM 121038]QCX76468.1 Tripeptidyl aminopeptidase precursor [Streptomyces sp. YIM 121038]
MAHSAPRRLVVPLLALGLTATLAPSLAAGPAAAAPDDAGARDLTRYTQQQLTWKRCAADMPAKFQCATLKVPLDYGAPRGKTLKVEISRVRTSKPGKRHGILTFNPGGPGASGLDLPLAASRGLPKAVLERYDLIGFDPRGIGRSSPLSCGLTEADQYFPRPTRSRAEFDRNAKWSKSVADRCRTKNPGVLPYINTRNTARDMDVMRAALGEKKLSYYGVSYGTALGSVYTQLFPKRADRVVLDSAVDPGLMWRGMFRIWAQEVGPAFERWSKWTAGRDATYHLGTSPAKVQRTFWKLVERADREPIVVDGQKLDGAGVRDLVRPEFFTVRSGAELVRELKRAAAGATVSGPSAAPVEDNELAAQFAVVCADAAWPRDPETYYRDVVRDTVRYPLYGDFTSGIAPCAYWPEGAEPVTEVDNGVPLLLVQNEWDSQTPLPGARNMHRALKGSRMITVEGGEGHGVLFNGEHRYPCVENPSMRYLATGKLPAKDVTCRVTPGQRRAGAAPNAF